MNLKNEPCWRSSKLWNKSILIQDATKAIWKKRVISCLMKDNKRHVDISQNGPLKSTPIISIEIVVTQSEGGWTSTVRKSQRAVQCWVSQVKSSEQSGRSWSLGWRATASWISSRKWRKYSEAMTWAPGKARSGACWRPSLLEHSSSSSSAALPAFRDSTLPPTSFKSPWRSDSPSPPWLR